jgi:ATP-dependent Clp protease adaptor protein ClpS
MNDLGKKYDTSGLVEQELQLKARRPNMYKVILINDDFTPMDFVVSILISFFGMTRQGATKIMLEVHFEGRGICGIYSRDVAETKVAQVNRHAQSCEYPLLCNMEIA